MNYIIKLVWDILSLAGIVIMVMMIVFIAANSIINTASGHVLMSDSDTSRWRQFMPKVDDLEVQAVLDDPALMIYTDREVPRAYQKMRGGLHGVHSAYYNISGDGREPYGNVNREFPWANPVGTDKVLGLKTVKAVWFPPFDGDTSRRKPMVWYPHRRPGDNTTGYAWIYPVGTKFFEFLLMPDPNRRYHVFEVRIRDREIDGWRVDIFRPFSTSVALAEYLKTIPDWQDYQRLNNAVRHLESPNTLRVASRRDRQPQRKIFRQTAGVDVLPQLDANLVYHLLDSVAFKSCAGSVWKTDSNGVECYAPTVKQGFNIVPPNYEGSFVEVGRNSCMRCHETTNMAADEFNRPRDWYGRVRGSDGIFSFHPFASSSISDNGSSRSINFNSKLTKNNLVERWSSSKHSREDYHRLAGVN